MTYIYHMHSAHTITWHIVGRHRTQTASYIYSLVSWPCGCKVLFQDWAVVCFVGPGHPIATSVLTLRYTLPMAPCPCNQSTLSWVERCSSTLWEKVSSSEMQVRVIIVLGFQKGKWGAHQDTQKSCTWTDMGASLYLVMGLPDPFGSSGSEPPGLTPSSLISLQFSPSNLLAYLCHTDMCPSQVLFHNLSWGWHFITASQVHLPSAVQALGLETHHYIGSDQGGADLSGGLRVLLSFLINWGFISVQRWTALYYLQYNLNISQATCWINQVPPYPPT